MIARKLSLLLWKNLMIKRRAWMRTSVELFLPLCLCLLLYGLRKSQPAILVGEKTFEARPLPSAGIFSLVENSCTNYQLDKNGFKNITGSKVKELLEFIDEYYRIIGLNASSQDEILRMLLISSSVSDKMETSATMNKLLNTEFINKLYELTKGLPISESCYVDKSRRTNFTEPLNDEINSLRFLWDLASYFVCGEMSEDRKKQMGNHTDPSSKEHLLHSFGIDSDQEKFVNKLLRSRPRILYAPNNTFADDVIDRMNRSAKMIEEAIELMENIVKISAESRESMKLVNLITDEELKAIKRLEYIEEVACTFIKGAKALPMDFFMGFNSEPSAVQYTMYEALKRNETVFASIIFMNAENFTIPPRVVYKIRQNVSMTPSTKSAMLPFKYPGAREYDQSYYGFGFLFLQDIIERSIIDIISNGSVMEPGSFIHQSPYPCFVSDNFLEFIEGLFPLIMAILWIYSVALLVENIVYEKQQGLQQVMHIMGVSREIIWLSWFIIVFIEMSFTTLLLTIILKKGDLLPASDPLFVFLLLEEFAFVTIILAILFSTFYSHSKLATACAAIKYFITSLPCLFISIREQTSMRISSSSLKFISSLSSTSAFGLAVRQLLFFEISGTGCGFNNFHKSPIDEETYAIMHAMIFMFVDCILYALLALYIDRVFPGKHEISSKWYFPIEYLYTKCDIYCFKKFGLSPFKRWHSTSNISSVERIPDHMEKEPDNAEVSINLISIYKAYDLSTNVEALHNLSLKIYKDQVTVILGHNGAGKTTLMNIINGTVAPTSGTVIVEQKRIKNRNDVWKANFGTCPQHNVFFDKLTVKEHLYLYSRLKSNKSYKDILLEVDEFMKEVDLVAKKDEFVGSLSGGMKRRLSIAIAFIGGSKNVVLDEPTAGVDPFARRSIWDAIFKYRSGRSIVITTHLLDEADILADRIIVVANGRLQVSGSPLFLKERFGNDYYLSLVPKSTVDVQRTEDAQSTFSENVKSFMEKFGPVPSLAKETAYENTFCLKGWSQDQIIELLKSLESEVLASELDISTFGIRDSTLNEIFMKTGMDGKRSPKPMSSQSSKTERNVNLVFPILKSYQNRAVLFLLQFYAVLFKHFFYTLRNLKTLLSQLILPVIFVSGGMFIVLPVIVMKESPPLEMNTFQFSTTKVEQKNVIFYSNEAINDTISFDPNRISTSSLVTSLYSVPGTGAECLIEDESNIWLDANWPPNKDRLNDSISLDYIIKNCRHRKKFDVGFFNKQLSYFSLPNYLDPKKGKSYYSECVCEKRGGGVFCSPIIDHKNHRLLSTGDHLYDLTGLDLPKYLVSSTSQFESRYGGFSYGFKKDNVPPHYGVNLTDSLRLLAVHHISKVWYNNRAFHAMPIFLNMHNNAILRANLRSNPNFSSINPGAYGISLINHPMYGGTEIFSNLRILQSNDVLISIFIMIGMSFVPASFVYFIVSERSSGSLHLQKMAGLNFLAYWSANFAWHLMNYLIPASLCIFLLWILQLPIYSHGSNFSALSLLFIFYGFASIPLIYVISFLFSDASNAYIVAICFNLFFGISTLLISFLLQLFGLENETIASLETHVRNVFLVFPGFALGRGILDIVFNDYFNQYYDFIGDLEQIKSPFSWTLLYQKLTILTSVGVCSFIFTLFMEVLLSLNLRSNQKVKSSSGIEESDDAVRMERKKIIINATESDAIRLVELTKVYNKRSKNKDHVIKAVDNLCLGIPKKECFGLLGVNGAGKTTLFKMLCGSIQPTAGQIFINKNNIARRFGWRALRNIGYCPQNDALIDELTGREYLKIFAFIYGYKSSSAKEIIDFLLEKLGLSSHADMRAGSYSGGMKRKLSLAISLIGDSQIILLDEPTSGMDPSARHFVHNIISNLASLGKTVILTSHNVEECETVCNRLSIMVNGKFLCLGSPQMLRDRFGGGYSLKIRMKNADIGIRNDIQKFILKKLPNAVVKEANFTHIHFEVRNCTLSSLFEICKRIREMEEYEIESYSISQNNLDNIFVSFVRNQIDSSDRLVRSHHDTSFYPIVCT